MLIKTYHFVYVYLPSYRSNDVKSCQVYNAADRCWCRWRKYVIEKLISDHFFNCILPHSRSILGCIWWIRANFDGLSLLFAWSMSASPKSQRRMYTFLQKYVIFTSLTYQPLSFRSFLWWTLHGHSNAHICMFHDEFSHHTSNPINPP